MIHAAGRHAYIRIHAMHIPSIPASSEVTDDEPPLSGSTSISSFFPLSPTLTGLTKRPQWHDWRWQMRHRIRTFSQLQSYFPSCNTEAGVCSVLPVFQMAITPYYASLMRSFDAADAIFRMAVPQPHELAHPSYLTTDPLCEEEHMPVPHLVHRYEDRALLITTSSCAMYCRYCTRKRVTRQREKIITQEQLARIVAYIRAHTEIKDVIISGGDPLTLSTPVLDMILAAIRAIPHVDIIRIGTRVPVTMPMRITEELTNCLRRYHPLWINTHFNHPWELTPESLSACTQLADAGIPLGNQSVLLRGVNDDPHVMEILCRGLVQMRVRPYYLFQCDLVPGVEDFRTPLARGIEIMSYMRGRLSGLAIPLFIVDAPEGGGKIPLLPDYVAYKSDTHTLLHGADGKMCRYPEPNSYESGLIPETPRAGKKNRNGRTKILQ